MEHPSPQSAAQDVFPLLRALPLTAGRGAGVMRHLLSQRQRRVLGSVSTRVTFAARQIVYREGAEAGFIFVCDEGALKAFRELPSGRSRIAAFLFRQDMFGLAENGLYLNTVKALRPSTCHRMAVETLATMLQRDGELGFMFLCKITHELRESQRRAILLARRSAIGRVAMFLTGLDARRERDHANKKVIALPMSRSDIADYLGLTLESVSRTLGRLAQQNVIATDGRNALRIVDRHRLDQLAYDL